jgi:hypothetical protein
MAGGSFSASRPNTCPPGLGRREFFGRRGSYENYGNNPLYPPYSKGEKDGRNPYLKGNKNVVARFILAYSIM